MNIEIKVDEVTLATVVDDIIGHDEDTGETYRSGGRTIGDLVARQLVDAARRETDRYRTLITKVTEIRTEMIRDAVRPEIEAAIAAPVKLTNSFGEATGRETTLRELIVAEARKALNAPVDGSGYRNSQTFVQKVVAEQVQNVLATEIASVVKAARDQVATEIGDAVKTAVQAGLRAR